MFRMACGFTFSSAVGSAPFIAVCMTILCAVSPSLCTAVDLRFAYQDRIADAASIIAVNKGLFKKHGLDVKPLRFSSGPACAEALYSGSADIGTMGDTTAVIAASRKAPLTIIARHGGGEHRHRIVVKADSPIETLNELKGKTLAVKKGTSTYGGLLAMLAGRNIGQTDLRIIDMRPSDMPEALQAGSVDAIVASEPTPSLAEARGARGLATLGGLGNTYPILLLARNRFIKEHPDAVVKFLAALIEASDLIRDHPDKAVGIVADATGLNKDVARKAMDNHVYGLDLGEETIASLNKIGEFLEENKTVPTAPSLKKAVDGTFLSQAQGGDKK